MKLWRSTVNHKWSNVSDFREPEVVRLLIHSTTDVPSGRTYQKSDTFDHWRSKWSNVSEVWWTSMKIYENLMKSGRMYQTSVRVLIHSTTDVPSGPMYQKWSNVSDFRQTSDTFDHWRSKWSNVSDLMKINENLWKSMQIIGNLTKIVWTSMKIYENLWKSMKISWKSMKI